MRNTIELDRKVLFVKVGYNQFYLYTNIGELKMQKNEFGYLHMSDSVLNYWMCYWEMYDEM